MDGVTKEEAVRYQAGKNAGQSWIDSGDVLFNNSSVLIKE